MSDSTTVGTSGQNGCPIDATVKWYSNNKGVGVVTPHDGGGDAVLRKAALLMLGSARIAPGDSVNCRIAESSTGRQVSEVIAVRSADTARHRGGPSGQGARRSRTVGSVREGHSPTGGPVTTGTVKFYDPWRGFGFVAPDGGGRDIYVDYRTLQAAHLPALEDRQRVQVVTRNGTKGPVAVKVMIA